jgi:ribosome-associated toxin RatA of RatAB toxin-antitoxin module
MQTTIGIDIEAPAHLVFDLARNVERWPALLPHYVRVRVRERHPDGSQNADMVAVRTIIPLLGLGIPVAWRATTWAEEQGLRLRFRHVAGATRGMDVTWRIEADGGGCRVSIEHDFRPRVAPWAALVDRLFVRPIAGRTLATFKAIAEAVVAAEAAGHQPPGRSEPGRRPKTSA